MQKAHLHDRNTWGSTAGTQRKEASHSRLLSPALFSSALMRPLLHEGGNMCSCTSAQVFAKASGLRSMVVVKTLCQTLHHSCSSVCMGTSRGKYISIPLCITEQWAHGCPNTYQNQQLQDPLLPMEKGSFGHHIPKTTTRKMQGPNEINYHNDCERQPSNNTPQFVPLSYK